MSGISSKAAGSLENKYKYNGIEFENDLDINTYDAFFRELDPQTGRWWQIDPKIEKMEAWSPYASNYDNPITYSDPLGDEPDEGPGDPPAKQGWFSKAWYNVVKPGMDWVNANVNPLTPIVELVTGKDYNNGGFDIDKPRAQSGAEAVISVIPGGTIVGAIEKTIVKDAAKVIETSIVKNIESKVVSLEKQVEKLVERNGGKNSVTIGTAGKQIRFDLKGAAHAGVPTPHIQSYTKNFLNGVQKSISRESKKATPMSKKDIRLILKYFNNLDKK
jgi:RHS repeat-associated protein